MALNTVSSHKVRLTSNLSATRGATVMKSKPASASSSRRRGEFDASSNGELTQILACWLRRRRRPHHRAGLVLGGGQLHFRRVHILKIFRDRKFGIAHRIFFNGRHSRGD